MNVENVGKKSIYFNYGGWMVKKLTINLIYLKFKDTICWTTNYYLVNKQKKTHLFYFSNLGIFLYTCII